MGISDFAKYGTDGTEVASPIFPFELIFEPTSEVNTLFSDNYVEDFTLLLA